MTQKPYLIIGLGNPGAKYKKNRHNVGFQLIDTMVDDIAAKALKPRYNSEVFSSKMDGVDLIFIKPQSFMNLSGEVIHKWLTYYKIPTSNIWVIHDDIDLAFMDVRIKHEGGHAGHNGLRSINEHIGDKYNRLRIGVGRPSSKEDVTNYVLENFTNEEWQLLQDLYKNVSQNFIYLIKSNESEFISKIKLIPM